ncbi:MAG: TIGR04255 family protein [Rhodobacter sp.]|jgi:uncharacterized protein (TIGR04255 family)|nr:TIGR04255 family protein [Rhodobacter sp.]
MEKLPEILEREPLVDALFEVRLRDTSPIADILPGILFQENGSTTKVSRLPVAELPPDMRASDPNLRYAPLVRVELEKYLVSVGDRSVLISCKLPYPKWKQFKAAILDIVARIAKLRVVGNVERYSLKYVNLIQAPTIAEQVSKINMSITLGDVKVSDDHANVQVHHKKDGIIHILSVVIGAQGNLADGQAVFGTIVDIDSIREFAPVDFAIFQQNLEPGLQDLRQANKKKFFACLTAEAIDEMGPVYA